MYKVHSYWVPLSYFVSGGFCYMFHLFFVLFSAACDNYLPVNMMPTLVVGIAISVEVGLIQCLLFLCETNLSL